MLPRRLPTLALILALGSCATPAPKPAPPARVTAPPVRPAPSAPMPTTSDWRDWPVTPGDWSYARDGRGSVARFGSAGGQVLTLRCEGGRISLARPGTAPAQLTIRTSSTLRIVAAQPAGDGSVIAVFAAGDPLLDAMGFSRGRFIVEQAGTRPLVIPAWAEILRVVEDCRG